MSGKMLRQSDPESPGLGLENNFFFFFSSSWVVEKGGARSEMRLADGACGRMLPSGDGASSVIWLLLAAL